MLVPPIPPFTVPDNVFALVNEKVSLPVPPVKLPKLLKFNVAVLSFTVPLLLPVMLQMLVVFSPTNVFAALPPVHYYLVSMS